MIEQRTVHIIFGYLDGNFFTNFERVWDFSPPDTSEVEDTDDYKFYPVSVAKTDEEFLKIAEQWTAFIEEEALRYASISDTFSMCGDGTDDALNALNHLVQIYGQLNDPRIIEPYRNFYDHFFNKKWLEDVEFPTPDEISSKKWKGY